MKQSLKFSHHWQKSLEARMAEVNDLVKSSLPDPALVEITFHPDTYIWTDREMKTGYKSHARPLVEAEKGMQTPEFKPAPQKMTGVIHFPREWEPTFIFENKEFKGGIFYDCVADIKVYNNES